MKSGYPTPEVPLTTVFLFLFLSSHVKKASYMPAIVQIYFANKMY